MGAGVNTQSQQQQSSGSSQQNTTASNFQNPAFVGNAGNTNSELNNIYNQLGFQTFSNANPFASGNVVGSSATAAGQNPLVAPVTGAQNATLGQIGSTLQGLPNTLQGAFATLQNEAQPNFAASLATSPETQAAEQSAIQPLRQQFASQTVPGLQGSFTQAGQRVGSASGMGSSAFDNSFAAAQGNELANEGAITGQIANNAYQTGLNITANAPGQIGSLTSSELNDMISGLNAQALPQLTQQYGITAGTQLYQQQLNTILEALGLQVQGEQPALGYNSTATSQQQGSGSGSGFGIGLNTTPLFGSH